MEDDNDDGGEGPSRTLTHNMRLAIGPGAPNDRNWDDYMDAIHTAGDQGYNLPAIGSFVLYKLEPQLKDKEDFDYWYGGVVRILRCHGLQRLIDINVKRPMRTSPNAQAWVELSMQVATWLAHCIDPEVVQDITSTGERTTLADDFTHQCKLHMRGELHGALSAAIIRFVNTKRTEFSTAGEFIDVVKQRYRTANNLKADISPYVATVIMASQLQEIPELRILIEIRDYEMRKIKDPAKEISVNDFFKYCADMQDKIRQFGIDSGAGAL